MLQNNGLERDKRNMKRYDRLRFVWLGILCLTAMWMHGIDISLADSAYEEEDEAREFAMEASFSAGKKDEDEDEDEGKGGFRGGYSILLPVSDATYRQECTACHFAYLPGLLPSASWRKIMNSLDHHFGENASLEDEETIESITAFLTKHAADRSRAWLAVRIMRDIQDKPAPDGVTSIPYIQRQHHEIPRRMIEDNPKVRTLANCIACHDRAEVGVFDEHDVRIPGYGYWED